MKRIVPTSCLIVVIAFACGCGGGSTSETPSSAVATNEDRLDGEHHSLATDPNKEYFITAVGGPPHLKFVCIGELLSSDGNGNRTYQYFLDKELYEIMARHDFVGSQNVVCDGVTLKGEGYPKTRLSSLAELVPNGLTDQNADMAIIYAGQQEIIDGISAVRAVNQYRVLIEKLRRIDPGLQFFVGQIVVSPESPLHERAQKFNKGLAELASELSNEKSIVVAVDHTKGFDAKTMLNPDAQSFSVEGIKHIAKGCAQTMFRTFWDKNGTGGY
ncbi:hypothetical protein Pan258_40480 [Symmachiella dynata]|uniref:hypothetical protein n=1 Tax=Symmachiella dynata TaxID=2527995 RepID=UPI00118B92CE|nr:hypothetical protein [Symmachiella dynata]QDT49992.1 hypothetical protein Pan258_40480 [Symmachiella dynata]